MMCIDGALGALLAIVIVFFVGLMVFLLMFADGPSKSGRVDDNEKEWWDKWGK